MTSKSRGDTNARKNLAGRRRWKSVDGLASSVTPSESEQRKREVRNLIKIGETLI